MLRVGWLLRLFVCLFVCSFKGCALCHHSQVGSQTPIFLIQQEHTSLRDRNEQQRKRVDEVLTERLNLEAKAKQVGEEVCLYVVKYVVLGCLFTLPVLHMMLPSMYSSCIVVRKLTM